MVVLLVGFVVMVVAWSCHKTRDGVGLMVALVAPAVQCITVVLLEEKVEWLKVVCLLVPVVWLLVGLVQIVKLERFPLPTHPQA